MKLKSWMVALAVALLVFGGIALTAALNLWRTESTKEPARYSSGELAGQYNPADIRGSYSFADIERSFGVSVTDLARAFGLSEQADPASFQVKSLEEMYAQAAQSEAEVGTDSVRWFVALYAGLPYAPEDTTFLPNPAVAVLRQKGTLAPADLELAEARRVDIGTLTGETADSAAAAVSAHAEPSEERTVKGNTTFGNLREWGVSAQELRQLLGEDPPAAGVTVRTWATGKGLEFSTIREKVQELVDSPR